MQLGKKFLATPLLMPAERFMFASMLALVMASPSTVQPIDHLKVPIDVATFVQAPKDKDRLGLGDVAPAPPDPPPATPSGDAGAPAEPTQMTWVIPRFARDLDDPSFWLPLHVGARTPVRFAVLQAPRGGAVTMDLLRYPPARANSDPTLQKGVTEIVADLEPNYYQQVDVDVRGLGRRDAFFLQVPTLDSLKAAKAIVDLDPRPNR